MLGSDVETGSGSDEASRDGSCAPASVNMGVHGRAAGRSPPHAAPAKPVNTEQSEKNPTLCMRDSHEGLRQRLRP